MHWSELNWNAKSMQCSFTKLKSTCNLNSTQCYFNGKVFKIANKTSDLVFHWINVSEEAVASDTLIQWNTKSYGY